MDATTILTSSSELDRSKNSFPQILLESEILAIGLFDVNLKMIQMNQAFCQVLSIHQDEFFNKNVLDLPFEDNSFLAKQLKKMLSSECLSFEQNEKIVFAKQEQVIQLKIQSIKENGKFNGGYILLSNVNSLVEKEHELEKNIDANISAEAIIHAASHDMKEPIRMIGNFIQLINKRNFDQLDESSKEYMQFVIDGVRNINKLIDDVIDYTALTKEEYSTKVINTQDLLYLTIYDLKSELADCQYDIEIKEVPELIKGDFKNIKKLFKSIILNAIKFRKKGVLPKIEICGKEQKACWKFEIKDNGIGIKKAYYEDIFQLFKRLHSKQQYAGSGVGLALCKKIIQQHNGEIWLDSKFEEGTSFYFTIAK